MDLHFYGTEVYDMWKEWMNLDVGAEMSKYAGAQAGWWVCHSYICRCAGREMGVS